MVIPTPILISCSTPPLSKSSTHIEKKLRIRRRILANWSVLTHTKMRQHQHQYNRRKTPTLCPRDLSVSIVLWFYSLPLLTFIPQKLWIFFAFLWVFDDSHQKNAMKPQSEPTFPEGTVHNFPNCRTKRCPFLFFFFLSWLEKEGIYTHI